MRTHCASQCFSLPTAAAHCRQTAAAREASLPGIRLQESVLQHAEMLRSWGKQLNLYSHGL